VIRDQPLERAEIAALATLIKDDKMANTLCGSCSNRRRRGNG